MTGTQKLSGVKKMDDVFEFLLVILVACGIVAIIVMVGSVIYTLVNGTEKPESYIEASVPSGVVIRDTNGDTFVVYYEEVEK